MSSDVAICNLALSHLGADATVASISPPDGSAEAGYCATFYSLARRTTLTAANWGFARRRATLAEMINDSDQWAFKYTLPNKCLHPRKVLMTGAADHPDRAGAPFELQDGAIYTNQVEAVLIYTIDVEDVSTFPPDFITALSQILAGYLAGPIVKGIEGVRIGDAWSQKGFVSASRAAAREANAALEPAEALTPAPIAARQ